MTDVTLIPADKALAMMEAVMAISETIKGTNNGKLMIMRIENKAHRDLVPELVAVGALKRATFLTCSDSVRAA